MENIADAAEYFEAELPTPVVKPGEFVIAAIGMDHGHIYGMTGSLIDAGATLKWAYDPDPAKLAAFLKRFPGATPARSEDEILSDPEVKLVASACVTSERAALGIRVMKSGKDYFVDKAPLTTLEQLAEVRRTIDETGRKYAVCYSERLQNEAAIFAGKLIDAGEIGKVIQVIGIGPHRLGTGRPDWFYRKEQYGGILCDIGSHQIEQFLHFSKAKSATIVSSKIGNYNHPEYPELDDFGDATLVADNGSSCYFRVDWFTPDGLGTWGDGRTFVLGTDGYIELRKYIDLSKTHGGNHVLWANKSGEHYVNATRKTGFPYFGKLIRDCIDRTETAMTQEHALLAAELCVRCQLEATELTGRKI